MEWKDCGTWVTQTFVKIFNITPMPITKILKELDNLPEEWLSSVPSKKAFLHWLIGHMGTHLEFTKEHFLWANGTKIEFFILKDNHFNWNRAGAAHCSAITRQHWTAQWAVSNKNMTSSLKKTAEQKKNKSSLQQHCVSHNQDNGLALEQIPKCLPVARPKPGLEVIWKSAGRPEDHGLPTRLIQSDNLQI